MRRGLRNLIVGVILTRLVPALALPMSGGTGSVKGNLSEAGRSEASECHSVGRTDLMITFLLLPA